MTPLSHLLIAPIDRPWEQPCAECGRFHSRVSALDRLKAAFPGYRFIGPKAELDCYVMHAVDSTANCVVLTVKPLPDLCYLCSGTGKVAPSTLKAAGGSERDALKKRISDLEGKHGWQWYEQKLDEANARAESYLAERDELKGKLDVQQEFIDDYRKTIDRLRTEVERLKGERDSVKHNFASLVAATEQGVDRIRAEKYLAVIEAGDHERLAIIAMHNAAMRAQGARSIAGLPTYVHEPSQEATCDERS